MNPGRELDAIVAEKIFGWKTESDGPDSVYRVDRGSDEGVPNYSTDIAAAWEVVEKIKDKRAKTSNFFLEWNAPTWSAGFIEYEPYESPDFDCCEADTAPHAVCLAALKAVGYEVTS